MLCAWLFFGGAGGRFFNGGSRECIVRPVRGQRGALPGNGERQGCWQRAA